MRSQASAVLPKALARRTAISGEMPAFSLTRLLRVWRVTPRTRAAAVTVRPSGARHSSLTMRPGWGGFFICMVSPNGSPRNRHRGRCRFRRESDAPILIDLDGPRSGLVALELVEIEAGEIHGGDLRGGGQGDQDVFDLAAQGRFHQLGLAVEQLFERLAAETFDHETIVS